MLFRTPVCIAAAVVLAVPALLLGQNRLSMTDAIAQALLANPQILSLSARVDQARGLRHQAGLAPNPRLVLQSENTRFTGSPGFVYGRDADSFAYLGQTFESGGKRERRVNLAGENIKRTELELRLNRQQIAGRVAAAYWVAAGAAQYQALLAEEETRFERVVQYHRDRVREGASAEIDLLRIEVERDRLLLSLNTAAQETERARISLFREMSQPDSPPVTFSDPAAEPVVLDNLTPEQAFTRRVEVLAAREAVDQARANLHLQEANARPDPEAFLGYKRTSGFNTLYASLQIPLPIRNRNQGEIEAASAGIRSAESQVAAAEALVRSEIELARRTLELRRAAIQSTLTPMRDRAEDVYRVAEAAYREGGLDFVRMIDAERTRLEARSAYIRAIMELQQSTVALSIAQGTIE